MSARPSRRRRTLVSLALLLALAVVGWFGWTVMRIHRQAQIQEARPADCIVVFGAAEYAGKPSPVFRARLDHAVSLYRRGFAPLIIVTGGFAGDAVSEGAVGGDYLRKQGIPDQALISETRGEDTALSAERVAGIMRRNGMHTCIAVSDDYHIFRIKQLLAGQGMEALGAPRPTQRYISRGERLKTLLREAGSYALWKLGLT